MVESNPKLQKETSYVSAKSGLDWPSEGDDSQYQQDAFIEDYSYP